MDNDKAFAVFAVALIGGVLSVITASVVAGFATAPSPLVFAEHVTMSLVFRAAYKSFGETIWPFTLFERDDSVEATEPMVVGGGVIEATG